MYKRLAKVLFRTRDSLHDACKALDIKLADLSPELMLIATCDWCSIWEKPKSMLEEADGTRYFKVCDEMHLYKYA